MSRSYGERLRIVQEARSGKTVKVLSKESGLHESLIKEWVRKYERYGRKGLQPRPRLQVSGKFREEIVQLFLEKGIPLSQIVVDYRLNRSTVEKWIRKARNQGYVALHENHRCGHSIEKPMGRPRKKEPQTELEKLQMENLYLRAENALLKKVKALVEAKEARARMNGHKPSKN